ncbi:MAG TPA: POTRA domain-containing protein [Bacteroidales bacterium]|nr:POTRA domain-containing protein [Bacteroidales bacterium]
MRARLVITLLTGWLFPGIILGAMAGSPGRLVIDTDSLVVRHILFAGNRITHESLLRRELPFREGNFLPVGEMEKRLTGGTQNIFNTRLFNHVRIDTLRTASRDSIDVKVTVVERWYIWPIPFFEISDRNFNVWWETREIRRLSYGVDLTFFNVRGRNETLQILLHGGFNQRYGFTYRFPFLDSRQKVGLGFGWSFDLNHEVPVATHENKPVFLRNDHVLLKKAINGFAEMVIRPDLYTYHTVRIGWSHNRLDSSVFHVAGFITEPRAIQDFFTVSYRYRHDRRDVQYYPLTGHCVDVEAGHTLPSGTARNTWLWTNLRYYRQLAARWYWASGFTGKLGLFGNPPYLLQRGLGYGRDIVRGYEYYVIDGRHFALLKNNLKYALIPRHVHTLDFIHTTKFSEVPLALYLNLIADAGYVAGAGGNSLQNRLVAGFGAGVDFVTYYDIVIRAEATVNHLFQPGIYLHFVAPI